GFLLGAIVMFLLLWAIKGLSTYALDAPASGSSLRRRVHAIVQPRMLNRMFRWLQTVSAAAMAVGHGMQDAAKTMGIIVLALYAGGLQDSPTHIPEWVYYSSATVLALG